MQLPFTNAVSPQARSAAHAHAAGSHRDGAGMDVEHWGVVVQTKWRSQADGCYVLKTVRSATPGGDCTCVHFSLVNVCKGEPYAVQMAASWLI
jgi:hypothetical protein